MKGIVIALIILGCLLGIWFVMDTGVYTDNEVDAQLSQGFLSFRAQDFSKVTRVTLSKGGGEPAELKKVNGEWVVSSLYDCPADGEKIDKIIKSLESIDTGAERGRTSNSHDRFEVDAKKGAVIACFNEDGSALAPVTIGKTSAGGAIGTTRVFVRFGEEAETFEVESDIRSEASLWGDEIEGRNYIEKDLFKLPEEMEIETVRVVRPEQQDLIVERRWREVPVESTGDEAAEGEEGEEGKEEKEPETKKEEYFVVTSGAESKEVPSSEKYTAQGILNRAKTLMIDDAAEPKGRTEYGLDQPQLTAVVQYRKKDDPESPLQTISLLFGNAKKDEKGEDKDYYFALDEGDAKGRVYVVRDYRFTGWDKKFEDFFPKPKEPEDEKSEEGDGATATSPTAGDGDESAPEAAGPEEPPAGGLAPAEDSSEEASAESTEGSLESGDSGETSAASDKTEEE